MSDQPDILMLAYHGRADLRSDRVFQDVVEVKLRSGFPERQYSPISCRLDTAD